MIYLIPCFVNWDSALFMLIFSLINKHICLLMKRFSYYGRICVNFILQKGRMVNNMEEKKKVIVVAKAGAIEIVVEGEKDDYELVLSKRQAAKLALDILYTVYKTGEKI